MIKKRIAIIGGGPSGLFIYKRLVEAGHADISIDIFEAKMHLGQGMPYSSDGANFEHITNVSSNEIPQLVTTIAEWLKTLPAETLRKFNIDVDHFSKYRVLPRLLFGQYLEAQFALLRQRADKDRLKTTVHLASPVVDIIDQNESKTVIVELAGGSRIIFDHVVICTGHLWPHPHEGRIPGYFDSPYPPSKLNGYFDHPIAIRGSSLTAVDAIRTLARQHGKFDRDEKGKLQYFPHDNAGQFRMVMHSRHGLLPCIRFHVENPHIDSGILISQEALAANRKENNGFISLDFIFDKNFKEPLRAKDPFFYDSIKNLTIEQFVEAILNKRERLDPFVLFKLEYAEAERSIRRHESIHWKEILSALSFAMNYPAKHMPAEDMIRHQRVLMPLISVVIAFVPQSSSEELIALQEAGRLDIISVGDDSRVEPNPHGGCVYHYTNDDGQALSVNYATFIDSIGQRHLSLDSFPFKTLVAEESIIAARLKFKSPDRAETMLAEGYKNITKEADNYYLTVSGLAITDDFQVIGRDQIGNPRIYMMAVPYIGGYNPDYSGLDFCEKASDLIAARIFNDNKTA